jgi:hypothetical protein
MTFLFFLFGEHFYGSVKPSCTASLASHGALTCSPRETISRHPPCLSGTAATGPSRGRLLLSGLSGPRPALPAAHDGTRLVARARTKLKVGPTRPQPLHNRLGCLARLCCSASPALRSAALRSGFALRPSVLPWAGAQPSLVRAPKPTPEGRTFPLSRAIAVRWRLSPRGHVAGSSRYASQILYHSRASDKCRPSVYRQPNAPTGTRTAP